MTSQSNPGLLGLDRTNTAGHPDTFQPIRSTNVPSTASRSSAGKRKVHFESSSGSVAESSGTHPTSVGSAPPRPEPTTITHKHGNRVQAGLDHHCPTPHEQVHDTLTGLGGHLPEIKHPGDFDADVGSLLEPLPHSDATAGPPVSTTAQPLVSEVNSPCRSRSKGRWTRKHNCGAEHSGPLKKALVGSSPAKERQRHNQTPSDVAPETAKPGELVNPIHTFCP